MLTDDVSWLLRTARRFAADERLRTASAFATGAGRAPAVHRSQVTRWESGQAQPSHAILRRYEVVLALPEGQLLAAVDTLARQEQPVHPAPYLPRPAPDDPGAVALPLLEKALGEGRMHGTDWDELSAVLALLPDALIRPRDAEALLRRGLLELNVSTGLEYALRGEAISRLAGHPRVGPVVFELARATLADPDAQVYSEVVALLNYTGHDGVAELLLHHVEHPVNDNALRAALFTAASQVRGRRMPAEIAGRVCRAAWERLCADDASHRVRRSAANLLLAVDQPTRQRLAHTVLARTRNTAAASILHGGSAFHSAAGQRLMTQVRRHLIETLGAPLEDHPTLRRLLDQSAQDTNEESRGTALTALMLSPVGPTVGAAYGAQLSAALARGDLTTAHEAVGTLCFLVQPGQLDLLTGLALGEDADLAVEACWAVGNCPEPDRAAAVSREQRLADRAYALAAGADGGAGAARELGALAYALGMRGRSDLLAGGPATGPWRQSADWWLDLPGHVRPEAPPG